MIVSEGRQNFVSEFSPWVVRTLVFENCHTDDRFTLFVQFDNKPIKALCRRTDVRVFHENVGGSTLSGDDPKDRLEDQTVPMPSMSVLLFWRVSSHGQTLFRIGTERVDRQCRDRWLQVSDNPRRVLRLSHSDDRYEPGQ